MADKTEKSMTFLGHLEELRWHIIRVVLAMCVGATLAFVFSRYIFEYILLAPRHPEFISNRLFNQLGVVLGIEGWGLNPTPLPLQNITMAGQFTTDLNISMIAGFILVFPYIAWQVWSFIAPALYENERRIARGAVAAISLLFLIGILFGYYIIVPFSVHFLGTYSVSPEVVSVINLNSYFSTIASVTLASGLVFELPVFVYFLTKVGILTPDFLVKYRRHAVVILLILAAVITPPDVYSQILVMGPLVVLYESSILLSRRVVKNREKMKITHET